MAYRFKNRGQMGSVPAFTCGFDLLSALFAHPAADRAVVADLVRWLIKSALAQVPRRTDHGGTL
jgi:hypothetical protein